MRDTLVMVGILAGITFGLMSFRQLTSTEPRPSSPGQAGALANHKAKLSNQGAKGERSNQLSDATESTRSSERSSGDVAEAQELPSIYSRKEQLSASAVGSKKRNRKMLIPGVPVQAYLDSQRNGLPNVTAESDDSMKVYLWCMEVKKGGLQYTGPRECQRIDGEKSHDLVMRTVTRH
jgi:hypothetical protein